MVNLLVNRRAGLARGSDLLNPANSSLAADGLLRRANLRAPVGFDRHLCWPDGGAGRKAITGRSLTSRTRAASVLSSEGIELADMRVHGY